MRKLIRFLGIVLIVIAAPSLSAGQSSCGFDSSVGRNPWLAAGPPRPAFDNLSPVAMMLITGDSSNPGTVQTPQPYRPKSDTSFWQRPTGALFKSVIFPGWGQFSNHKYQKAAVFFGLETLFMYKSIKYFVQTRDRFDTFQKTKNRQDFFAYDAARKSRNKYYWFAAGTIFISMWDAYADAHIKPFEETKNNDDFWGINPADRPRVSPPALSLALTIHF